MRSGISPTKKPTAYSQHITAKYVAYAVAFSYNFSSGCIKLRFKARKKKLKNVTQNAIH